MLECARALAIVLGTALAMDRRKNLRWLLLRLLQRFAIRSDVAICCGFCNGSCDGSWDGTDVGLEKGTCDGSWDGFCDGSEVGMCDGTFYNPLHKFLPRVDCRNLIWFWQWLLWRFLWIRCWSVRGLFSWYLGLFCDRSNGRICNGSC